MPYIGKRRLRACVALIEAQQFLQATQSLLPTEIVDVAADRKANHEVGERER